MQSMKEAIKLKGKAVSTFPQETGPNFKFSPSVITD